MKLRDCSAISLPAANGVAFALDIRSKSIHKYHMKVCEPCVRVQPAGSGGKWRRRRARWLMAERACITGVWRASQAAYRPAASTGYPCATLDMVPPTFKVRPAALLDAKPWTQWPFRKMLEVKTAVQIPRRLCSIYCCACCCLTIDLPTPRCLYRMQRSCRAWCIVTSQVPNLASSGTLQLQMGICSDCDLEVKERFSVAACRSWWDSRCAIP